MISKLLAALIFCIFKYSQNSIAGEQQTGNSWAYGRRGAFTAAGPHCPMQGGGRGKGT